MSGGAAYNSGMELQLCVGRFYRVKKGQTIETVARALQIPPRVLAVANGLKGELSAGQVIELPPKERNLYTVRGGESASLLCGSAQAFQARNGTALLYPMQQIFL